MLVSVKSAPVKQKGTNYEAFEVEPSSKILIPSHSHIFATVIFKPAAMQCYNGTFEVTPDGIKSNKLVFELQGEGNLPQVSITQPTLRNAMGQPLLLYKRLLLSQSQALPVTLKNTGTIPAKVLLEITGSKAFTLMCEDSDEIISDLNINKSCKLHNASSNPPCLLSLSVGESKECLVVFKPDSVKGYRNQLCMKIQDNQYERLLVHLVGEGYEDEVCLENVRGEALRWPEAAMEVTEDLEGECV